MCRQSTRNYHTYFGKHKWNFCLPAQSRRFYTKLGKIITDYIECPLHCSALAIYRGNQFLSHLLDVWLCKRALSCALNDLPNFGPGPSSKRFRTYVYIESCHYPPYTAQFNFKVGMFTQVPCSAPSKKWSENQDFHLNFTNHHISTFRFFQRLCYGRKNPQVRPFVEFHTK